MYHGEVQELTLTDHLESELAFSLTGLGTTIAHWTLSTSFGVSVGVKVNKNKISLVSFSPCCFSVQTRGPMGSGPNYPMTCGSCGSATFPVRCAGFGRFEDVYTRQMSLGAYVEALVEECGPDPLSAAILATSFTERLEDLAAYARWPETAKARSQGDERKIHMLMRKRAVRPLGGKG